ncbi:hypothetical protein EV643_12266 [Kribbella sp. VKM Ac-2527]|uniref:Uncharacterized protein n=1 Tax=Kribbella caucasensis TaxID=2512215 RepID=A0A4R6JM26_9ACTN|nr:hypothetical protein [Kribbella sp. VKM Ac-2527]TDO35655.1 hypothetical protein EV643_12266 [Kribbella sp. VKM Ac-2527]
MSVYVVRDDSEFLWIAAVIAEDIYTYVPNTGKFHRNDGLREDFFMTRNLTYEEVTVTKAKDAIDAGLTPLDEQTMADHLSKWSQDPEALDPEQVFASVIADLR